MNEHKQDEHEDIEKKEVSVDCGPDGGGFGGCRMAKCV